MTDPNAPIPTEHPGRELVDADASPPEAPPPARHGARLDKVLADAAALSGFPDVRVETGRATVAVFALNRAESPTRFPVAAGYRSLDVFRGPYAGKVSVPVTVEGAIASALRPLAAKKRAEADDRVAAARKALREAEEAARVAAERETRLANFVLEDLAAVGEKGEPCPKQPEASP